MNRSSAQHFTRTDRCSPKPYQQVPGNFSFRQEWPLKKCEYVECDETDKNDLPNQPSPPGPLMKFDIMVKTFLKGNVFGQATPGGLKRSPRPKMLSRHTAEALKAVPQVAGGDEFYRSFARRLENLDKHCRYEQALVAAEVAAETAPPELAEQAAVETAKGYTVSMDSKKLIGVDGERIVEVVSYMGMTKPQIYN